MVNLNLKQTRRCGPGGGGGGGLGVLRERQVVGGLPTGNFFSTSDPPSGLNSILLRQYVNIGHTSLIVFTSHMF